MSAMVRVLAKISPVIDTHPNVAGISQDKYLPHEKMNVLVCCADLWQCTLMTILS